MKEGFFSVAKNFILHRATHGEQGSTSFAHALPAEEKKMRQFTIAGENKTTYTITEAQLFSRLKFACRGLEELASAEELLESSIGNFYEGIKESEVDQANIMAARTKIEIEPAYSQSRLAPPARCPLPRDDGASPPPILPLSPPPRILQEIPQTQCRRRQSQP